MIGRWNSNRINGASSIHIFHHGLCSSPPPCGGLLAVPQALGSPLAFGGRGIVLSCEEGANEET